MEIVIKKSLEHVLFQTVGGSLFFLAQSDTQGRWYIVSTMPNLSGDRIPNILQHVELVAAYYNDASIMREHSWSSWGSLVNSELPFPTHNPATEAVFRFYDATIRLGEIIEDAINGDARYESSGAMYQTISEITASAANSFLGYGEWVMGDHGVTRVDADSQPLIRIRPPRRTSPPIRKEKKIMPEKMFLKDVIGDITYQGFHGYHAHHHDDNNYMPHGGTLEYPYWVGVELEVECNNRDCFEQLTQMKSNWFYVERDGSLDSDYFGAEIITIRMTPKVAADPATWAELLECLRDGGATSYENGRCGIHVHISKTGLGKTDDERDATVGKLYHLYNNELGAGGYGGDYVRRVMQRSYQDYCRPVIRYMDDSKSQYFDFVRHYGADSVKKETTDKVFKNLSKVDSGEYDRYSAISLVNRDTIEFRQGKGTLVLESFIAKVQFAIQIVEFCRKTSMKNCSREGFFNHLRKLPKENSLRITLNI